eukprot:403339040
MHSQQLNSFSHKLHHPSRQENYSLQFNSQYSKSSRGMAASNYMLNDQMLSQSEFDGDILEGTQTFHQLNQFNNQELIQLNADDREKEESEPLALQKQKQNNYLTESEVQEIIRHFNQCLNKQLLEKGDLEKKTKNMIERIDDQQQIIIRLFKEKENYSMDNDSIGLQIDQGNRNLKYLEKERLMILKYRPIGLQETSTSPSNSNLQQQDQALILQKQSNLLNILNNLPSLDQQQKDHLKVHLQQNLFDKIQQLEAQKVLLIDQNQELKQKIQEDYEHSKVSQTKCQKCRQQFIPLHNTEESCSFHPGKMKFYSCRGCGANQYFSCCNKCALCCQGCKKQKHIA